MIKINTIGDETTTREWDNARKTVIFAALAFYLMEKSV